MTFKAFCIGGKTIQPKEYHAATKISMASRSHHTLPLGPLVFGSISMTVDRPAFEHKADGTLQVGASGDAPWRSSHAKVVKEEKRDDVREQELGARSFTNFSNICSLIKFDKAKTVLSTPQGGVPRQGNPC